MASTPDVLYEDDDVLVINKPPGLSVHRSAKETKGTLVDELTASGYDLLGVGEHPDRPGIVHRLDKDTSGVLVVAKSNEAFRELKQLFQSRKIEKRYLAIVDGRVRQPRGVIALPIGRYGLKRIAVNDTQKAIKVRDAETEFLVRKRFLDATLVELMPKTGRMHQLRVHMKAIGHPILGDKLYGGKRVVARAPRQMLHAQYLAFSRADGRRYAFEADPPSDFDEVLTQLSQQELDEKIYKE